MGREEADVFGGEVEGAPIPQLRRFRLLARPKRRVEHGAPSFLQERLHPSESRGQARQIPGIGCRSQQARLELACKRPWKGLIWRRARPKWASKPKCRGAGQNVGSGGCSSPGLAALHKGGLGAGGKCRTAHGGHTVVQTVRMYGMLPHSRGMAGRPLQYRGSGRRASEWAR